MPDTAIPIDTYAKLDRYMLHFAKGRLACLFLIGPPGVQKSISVRNALGSSAHYISGQATPFEIYVDLCEERPDIVVLDDVDGLYRSPAGVRLLKSLCSSQTRKTISWLSNAVHARGLPTKITLDCKVIVIANEWETLSENVLAVEDRGVVLSFNPPPLEVHIRTADWYWNQAIFEYVAAHLQFFRRLSMRMYEFAWQLKSEGDDGRTWREYILAHSDLDRKDRLLVSLLADPALPSDAEKAEAFEKQGGGCRATYFNRKKALPPQLDVPYLAVKGKPPAPESIDPDNFRASREWNDLHDFFQNPTERR